MIAMILTVMSAKRLMYDIRPIKAQRSFCYKCLLTQPHKNVIVVHQEHQPINKLVHTPCPPKLALIIPAWKHSATDTAYTNIAVTLRAAGYQVISQDIAWRHSTFAEWQATITSALTQTTPPITICAFQLGAMATLVAASKIPIENLVLCSPSGYFKEYSDQVLPIERRWMGDARKAEFMQLSGQAVLQGIQVKHGYIIVDEGEFVGRPAYKQWIDDLIKTTGWPLTLVSHEQYGISSPGYQRAVINTLRGL